MSCLSSQDARPLARNPCAGPPGVHVLQAGVARVFCCGVYVIMARGVVFSFPSAYVVRSSHLAGSICCHR